MAIQGVTNQRIMDLGAGMNSYLAPSMLNNNEAAYLQNAITEGTSIKSIPGSVFYNTPNLDLSMTRLTWAPAMVYTNTMRTLCVVSYGDWVLQVITPTDSWAVGYNYAAIRAYNQRLNIEKTTVTTFSVSNLKDLRISWLTYKLTNVYLVIWGSGSGNTEVHAFKLNESNGAITEWDTTTPTSNVTVPYFGMKTVAFVDTRLMIGWAPLQPWVLYFSRPASATNPEYAFDFSWTGSWARVVSTGWRISKIFENNDKLYIGTDTEIYSGVFTDATTLQTTLFANSGILCHEAQEVVNQESFFFDGRDVRRLSYEANILAIKDSSVSDKIRNTIANLPEGNQLSKYKLDTISSSFLFPLYKLYARSLSADTPDVAFVYNVIDKSWSIHTVQVKSSCIISYNKRSLITTNGTLELQIQDDTHYGYGGGATTLIYASPEYSFWDNVDYKRYVQYEIYGDITDEVKARVDFYIDGELKLTKYTKVHALHSPTTGASTLGSTPLGANSQQNTTSGFRERFEMFMDGQSIQVVVTLTEVAYIKIYGHNFQYKFVPAYPIH